MPLPEAASRLPDNRDVWRIAAPMILSNVTVPLLGMVDTAVVGHLDSPIYLGAVAVGAMIFSFLYTGMNFLRMGTTGIAAQAFGAQDHAGLRVSLGQALLVALGIALLVILWQGPIARLALQLAGADGEVTDAAGTYFAVRIWSAPGALANFVLIGWFLGLQNARVPFLIFLTVNLTNIALDIVFVAGLGMTVDGVALASVIADYSGVAVGLVFAVRALRDHPAQWPFAKLFRWREYAAFFAVNGNLFLRTMALMFTLAFVTAQSARLGPLILAANAVLMNLQNLTAFCLDGIAHAAEALVGKAVGERRRNAVEHAVRVTLRWSLYFAGGLTLAYLLLGPALIRVLTDIDDVRATAIRYLPFLVASPLVSVWCFLYDGVFVGATRSREMRDIMVVSAFAVFLPAWFVLRPLDNDGLWLALLAFLASRGIGMHFYYRRHVLPAI